MTDPWSLDSVRQVLGEHRLEIMRRHRAAGIGIGRPDASGPYVITVYLTHASDIPSEPEKVEGIQLHFQVAGPFRPLGSIGTHTPRRSE